MATRSKTQTRDLPGLSLRAAVAPSSINEEKRTVDLQWSTGEKVLRTDWDGSYFEELSMDPKSVRMGRLTSGRAPFLANHDGWSLDSVIGVIESARIENGRGFATVRFAKDDPAADAAWNKVRQGVLTNVSVGYRTYKMEKMKTGTDETPVYRAQDWEPYECSLVPMGADSTAQLRSKPETNPCVFVTPVEESRTMTPEEIAAAELKAKQEADAQATRAAELKNAADAAVKADRERVSGIHAAVRSLGASGAALAAKLIAAGTDLNSARAQVLEALAQRSDEQEVQPGHTGANTVTDDNTDKFMRGASAWLIQRAGDSAVRDAVAKKIKGFEKIETDPGEYRGMTLFELAKESLERRNVKTRGMSKNQVVDMAMTYRAGGYTPASDFAVLYENIMHKMLLGAYATQADTWSEFCKTDTVPDFRLSNRYRVGSFGTMPVVKEGEEYTNAPLPDGQKTSISTETKGRMIALSRQAIINDDMSSNADLAARFGRGFRLSIEKEVYALINAGSGLGANQADGQPFFHANRANVNATGSVLSVAGIDADRVVMAKQKDISSNEYLNLKPAVLLVPIALGSAARIINSAQYDFDGTKLMRPNPVQNLFTKVIDTPQLTDAARRYLFTDVQVAPAIVVAFLAGSGEAPFLEQQLGWRVDGIEWKARLDFLAQWFDPKGAVTNAGA